MKFTIAMLSFSAFNEQFPAWVLVLIILVFSLFLSALTFRVAVEISDKLKLKNGFRFLKLFCGWASLVCFSVSGLFSAGTQQNLTAVSLGFLLLLFILYSIEVDVKPSIEERRWKYCESKKPLSRIILKLVLSWLCLCFSLGKVVIYNELNSLVLGSSILSVLLLSQLVNKPHQFKSFQRPNEFESERVMFKLITLFPLLFVITVNSTLLKQVSNVLSLPVVSGILGITGFFFGFLSFRGISITKIHQDNPRQRSLVSYPIAIQSKDKKAFDRQQIYNAISKHYSQSQVYIEKISFGLPETKAELVVVDWKEYERKDLEKERNDFHKKLIEVLTINTEDSKDFKELEVLNFDTTRNDKKIETAVPKKRQKDRKTYKLSKLVLFLKRPRLS